MVKQNVRVPYISREVMQSWSQSEAIQGVREINQDNVTLYSIDSSQNYAKKADHKFYFIESFK